MTYQNVLLRHLVGQYRGTFGTHGGREVVQKLTTGSVRPSDHTRSRRQTVRVVDTTRAVPRPVGLSPRRNATPAARARRPAADWRSPGVNANHVGSLSRWPSSTCSRNTSSGSSSRRAPSDARPVKRAVAKQVQPRLGVEPAVAAEHHSLRRARHEPAPGRGIAERDLVRAAWARGVGRARRRRLGWIS